ncbi:MAG: DMT family transporter [Alphaproteobacteria bacterium]|nr:DMT family transporter [Alphaproteobacteria bacterium]
MTEPTDKATTADDGSGDRPAVAIGMLLFGMFLFTAMDGMAKTLAGQGLPPERITLLRFLLVMLMLVPVVALKWQDRPLRTRRPGLHILRGVLLISSATLFVYAMRSLPLETATAIGFVSPLYVTALSIPFLGEKVGVRRWMAVIVGFGGVMVILRPGTDAFQLAMLIPLLSSLLWAAGLIITRWMRGHESPLTILIWSTGSGLIAVAPLGLYGWESPTWPQLGLLALIACCHMAGQYLTIRAFMMASASMLAPFSYSTIIWATLIGVFVFGSFPDMPTLIGTTVLAASGLYVWYRERQRAIEPTVPGGSIAEVAQDLIPSTDTDGAEADKREA